MIHKIKHVTFLMKVTTEGLSSTLLLLQSGFIKGVCLQPVTHHRAPLWVSELDSQKLDTNHYGMLAICHVTSYGCETYVFHSCENKKKSCYASPSILNKLSLS